MKNTKKLLVGAVIALGTIALAGCTSNGRSGSSSASNNPKDITVGISMPDKALQRWTSAAADLSKDLKSKGYKVDVQYAASSTSTQSQQVQNMANKGEKYIVIAAQDGTTLGPAVAAAKKNGAKVIAYDRLIMNTPDVDYYATYNLQGVGKLQGESIIKKLGLDKGAKGPFNIELLGGSPTDNNAPQFFKGAMSVLDPYFKSGALVSLSSKGVGDNFQQVAIEWTQQAAQTEMQTRLNSFYNGGKKLDAVLAPNDAQAFGVISALKAAGVDPTKVVITGQDCETQNVPLIVKGEQYMSVYKSDVKLSDTVTSIVYNSTKNKTVKTDSKSNNGKTDVPTIQLTPEAVTKDNVKATLVDSGYITAAKAGLN
ncbi:substrate-binding domain-containing protein [Lactococcus hircilactis]|uniref:Substrate-binding domain-containing protein n=1 Tax=Lactococcus hircilactis TaxID=1494462 RepID=A0A7X2CZL9_9LACT|nr:sugar-binding protein [Lactococcus hircilactis]MQW38589.1 substrate-binding domain-containing protein [Lactococcus hircilactis]